MSATAPDPKVQPRPSRPSLPQRPHPFVKLCMGKAQVVLRQKGSNSVISGTCKWHRSGFLKLTDATIEPPSQPAFTVPWVLVEQQTIAHIHPNVKATPNEPGVEDSV